MKKTIALLLTVTLLLALAASACADAVTRKDILDAFPGYEYLKDTGLLQLKDGDLHEQPELADGERCVYVIMSDSKSSLSFYIAAGGSRDRGMPHKMFVRTINADGTGKEYEIDFLADKVGNSTMALLDCGLFGDLADLPADISDAAMVSVVLRNNRIAEDEEFFLNDAQLKLIKMCYSYSSGIAAKLTKKEKNGLQFVRTLLKGSQQYTVTVNPYVYTAHAANGTGGLYPWLTDYMRERYPDYSTEGKTVEDYITYIIGVNGLGLTYDQLYNMLAVLNDETVIFNTLDALTRK